MAISIGDTAKYIRRYTNLHISAPTLWSMSRSHNYNIWRLRRVDGQQAGGGAPLDQQSQHPNRGVNCFKVICQDIKITAYLIGHSTSYIFICA